ncbi:MAG: alpha/beta fold hydrolase, partial [Gammaproteobacteria bacterium]|nr:alpha/beta fold hydrolase [Gammaproteobacteria bacterium]
KNIVTVGQDWGGPITLRYAIEHQSNIRGLVILNTSIERFPANFREKITQNRIFDPLPSIFRFFFKNAEFSSTQIRQLDAFRQFVWDGWVSGNQSDFGAGFRHPVDQKVMRNYLFPNDNWASRAGVANFVKSISDSAEDSNAAYLDEIRDVLKNWNIPMLVLFPDGDFMWKPEQGQAVARMVPNGEFYLIRNAGHFMQEDAGEEIAGYIIRFIRERV